MINTFIEWSCYLLPTVLAAILIYGFTLLMFSTNDEQFTSNEMNVLMLDSILLGLVILYQVIVYSVSYRKIKGLLKI